MSEMIELTIEREAGGAARLTLAKGDITTVRVEAIVNAANSYLTAGGGVDGAIHRAAGPQLQSELDRLYRGCPTGSAVITGSGRLAEHGVRWVVHAVGPIWLGGAGGEEIHLRSAYRAALDLADEAGAQSIAFPAISCGVFGYPLDDAAAVSVESARDGLAAASNLIEARFVLFSNDILAAFQRALAVLAAQ